LDFLAQLVDRYEVLKYALLEAQTYDPDHFGFPPIYYRIMESDRQRIDAFRRAFAGYDFRNKVVCEAGVGRLALAEHYLPLVRKAYLIENNPALRPWLEARIHEGGWQEKVELIFADARRVQLPEPVDALIAEMMSIFAINEHQVPVFQHLRQFLRPGGRLFPERILNLLQLARAEFDEEHHHYPINFSRHLPEVLSLPVLVQAIDLYAEDQPGLTTEVNLVPLLSGTVNAVFLRSMIGISEGCNFTGTDSLMPPTVVRLAEPRQVKAGEAVRLRVSYRYGTSLGESVFELV
jgi:predicted RNA methylase